MTPAARWPGRRGPRGAGLAVALAALLAGCAPAVRDRADAERLLRPHDLMLRPAAAGPAPAVVVAHGCSGVQANERAWAAWLRDEGYVALVVDSLTGRGLARMPWSRSVCHGGVFWGATRAGDLEASLDHLRAQSFVDPDRLAVIGWSHGGWTVLDLLATAPAAGLRGLRAAVAFYPYCGVASAAARRGWTQPVPLLVLLAGADDVTPPGPCRALADRQRARHTPVTVQLYPGARHAFDYDIPPRAAAWVRRELGFELVHDPAAAADARARVRAFLDERLRAVPAGRQS